MKIKYINLYLMILLLAVMVNCAKDEMRYIDPMVFGITENTDDKISSIAEGSWSSAIVGLKEQRLKLIGLKERVLNDGYSGDNYTLEDPQSITQRIELSVAQVTFIMDSLWDANIQNVFDAVNKNSAGIQNFGLKTYNKTSTTVSNYYNWLMAETKDTEGEVLVANNLVSLLSDIDVLSGLAALNDAEVNEFVNNIKAQYAKMKLEYAALASDVASSPYYSKAQKALYASLKQPLADMETTINENLSLAAKAQLDAIDQQLYSLVYFSQNNYTSPAVKPVVYGEISNISELRWFSEVATVDDWNGSWVLTADIDAAETHRWNLNAEEKGFRTIRSTVSCKFDGQFHIISGLLMTKMGSAGNDQRSGFFGDLNGGSIKNLGLINATYVVGASAGPGGQGGVLAGRVVNSTISKCFVHGSMELTAQAGGFIGRPNGGVVITDCFAAVECTQGATSATNTTSFIGLPVLSITINNCYNIGKTKSRAIFGYGSSVILTASGIFFDSQTVGVTVLEPSIAMYAATSPNKLSDAGVVTDLPTASWDNLSNFTGFSSDVWEIKTVSIIDANTRPYLKGFNFEAINDFLIPE